jgi:hypothetical protein
MRIGKIRTEIDGLFAGGGGLVELADVVKDSAKVGVGLGLTGIERDRLVEYRNRFLGQPLLGQR